MVTSSPLGITIVASHTTGRRSISRVSTWVIFVIGGRRSICGKGESPHAARGNRLHPFGRAGTLAPCPPSWTSCSLPRVTHDDTHDRLERQRRDGAAERHADPEAWGQRSR